MSDPCSIQGCLKPRRAGGWCAIHWYRWRKHGDPLGGGPPRVAKAFVEKAVTYDGTDCLEWPFYRNPFGYAVFGRHIASRFVCERAHGLPPGQNYDAAHSCGNKGCVAPRHLRWATRQENEQDKLLHGRSNRGKGGAKLTPTIVLKIKNDWRHRTSSSLAKELGVTPSAIDSIKSNRTWAWL